VQYARAPVILLVVGNLLNIVLDVWLVMGLHMNVQGAALATAIAEYGTFIIGLWMVWRVLAMRGISLALLKTAWRGNIRKLLALNRDIMLRSLLLQLCFGALTVFGARLGPEIVAVNAVLMTLLTFTAYALDGFAYAVEAHSGQAYGARESGQLRTSGGQPAVSLGWWRWRSAWFTPALVSKSLRCLRLFPALRELASHYLIWQVILPVVGVWCYLLDGMFIGATRGAEMRNSMAVAAAGFGLTLLTLPGWVITVCGWPWPFSLAARDIAGFYLAPPLAKQYLVPFASRYIVTVKDSEYEINCRILNYNNYHVQQKRT
jgi:MATE family multidrug resistance protein